MNSFSIPTNNAFNDFVIPRAHESSLRKSHMQSLEILLRKKKKLACVCSGNLCTASCKVLNTLYHVTTPERRIHSIHNIRTKFSI